MATNNAVNSALAGTTGSGNFVGSTSPVLVSPALGTPSSGVLTNCTGLSASGVASNGGAGIPVQVVVAQTTTPTSIATSTFTTLGLSGTITPTSATSKILVRATVSIGGNTAADVPYLRIFNGSVAIGVGTSVGSRIACTTGASPGNGQVLSSAVLEWLDSPATTSPITYTIQGMTPSGGSLRINATATDNDSALYGRGVSQITLMEIK